MAQLPDHGIARVAISGDQEVGLSFLPEAKALLRKTLERMRLGGLQQLSDQRRLSDDAYCQVIVAGGINQIHIVAGSPALPEPPPYIRAEQPDFVSGAVHNGYITQPDPKLPETLETFHPTLETAHKFKLPYAYQSSERLAVTPYAPFGSELNAPKNSPHTYAQTTKLKATLYTGRMRRLVQALLGFGRQKKVNHHEVSIYNSHLTPAEAAKKKAKPPTTYEKQVSKDGLQIRYDWHFSRSHGISTAVDGKKWIVEVGITRGVVAWPLALHEGTTTKAFREKLDKNGDLEGGALVDEFGGFPTGESLPPAEQFDAWVRAGKLLQLVSHEDMDPFYGPHAPYGSTMGWAFNLRGDEAHNTAWRFGEDGVQRGVHYMVPIQIGTQPKAKTPAGADTLRNAMQSLTGEDYANGLPAALWKVDYLSEFQMRSALSALQHGADALFQYVDPLVLTPFVEASAHLSKVSEGALWYPPNARIENGYIMRFPEPLLNLLVAHSMKPNSLTAKAPKRCDTTVHVFFDGNELKWVKFYQDNGPGKKGTTTDDYAQCMYIGTWSRHTDNGTLKVPSMYYSTDFDDRAELPAGTVDTKISSLDFGYNAITANDDLLDPSTGHASRQKRFRRRTEITSVYGQGIGTGIAIPFHDREAYYYAVHTTVGGTSRTVDYTYTYLTDPWSCYYKRNFPGYYGFYAGDGTKNDPWRPVHLEDVNGYGPNEYRTADPSSPIYSNTGPCRDIADSGPWMKPGDNIDAMLYSIAPPPLPATEVDNTDAKGTYNVWLVQSNGLGPLRTDIVNSLYFGLWPLWTPNLGDGYSADQYIEATCNAMGKATSARADDNLNSGSHMHGEPQWPEMNTGFLTYIGVINAD